MVKLLLEESPSFSPIPFATGRYGALSIRLPRTVLRLFLGGMQGAMPFSMSAALNQLAF